MRFVSKYPARKRRYLKQEGEMGLSPSPLIQSTKLQRHFSEVDYDSHEIQGSFPTSNPVLPMFSGVAMWVFSSLCSEDIMKHEVGEMGLIPSS